MFFSFAISSSKRFGTADAILVIGGFVFCPDRGLSRFCGRQILRISQSLYYSSLLAEGSRSNDESSDELVTSTIDRVLDSRQKPRVHGILIFWLVLEFFLQVLWLNLQPNPTSSLSLNLKVFSI